MDGSEERGIIVAVLFLASCFMLHSASAEQKPLSGLNIEEFEQKSGTETNWNNNPFVVPASDVAVSELKLSGIVYSEGDSAAIVNDQVVKVGDKIGSSKVVNIEKARVVIRNENGLFGLVLGGGK